MCTVPGGEASYGKGKQADKTAMEREAADPILESSGFDVYVHYIRTMGEGGAPKNDIFLLSNLFLLYLGYSQGYRNEGRWGGATFCWGGGGAGWSSGALWSGGGGCGFFRAEDGDFLGRTSRWAIKSMRDTLKTTF